MINNYAIINATDYLNPATIEAQVIGLHQQATQQSLPDDLSDARSCLANIGDKCNQTFLAVHPTTNQVVGCMTATIDKDSIQVRDLTVSQAYQGMGIEAEFLNRVVNKAKEQYKTCVVLHFLGAGKFATPLARTTEANKISFCNSFASSNGSVEAYPNVEKSHYDDECHIRVTCTLKYSKTENIKYFAGLNFLSKIMG